MTPTSEQNSWRHERTIQLFIDQWRKRCMSLARLESDDHNSELRLPQISHHFSNFKLQNFWVFKGDLNYKKVLSKNTLYLADMFTLTMLFQKWVSSVDQSVFSWLRGKWGRMPITSGFPLHPAFPYLSLYWNCLGNAQYSMRTQKNKSNWKELIYDRFLFILWKTPHLSSSDRRVASKRLNNIDSFVLFFYRKL